MNEVAEAAAVGDVGRAVCEESVTKARTLKDMGNEAYRNGRHAEAVELFSLAIGLDPSSATLYCNRSMSKGALEDWAGSAQDALLALKIDPDYLKAHYRLVKAKIELKQLRESQYFLLAAYSACGSSKELKTLEAEFQNVFNCSFKPKPSDFKMIEGLGEGNFSKIFKVEFKATKTLYAMKVIEKLGAEKIKRRHPNVHNEILMEKRVLNALSHPNIVMLFGTFQDAESLYYQMEYLDGGEVWALINDKEYNKMVGCPRSMTRLVLAEALNALEYMHRKGVVHRDIKPENMMLTDKGHLKLVDFGTCKDLINTDLNGPQFVGTAEYMSPETIQSRKTGPAADLWSLGIVAFQMLYGYTPFIGASPYMTFLRIKRALLRLPFNHKFVPDESELLELLLNRNPNERFAQCSGTVEQDGFIFNPDFLYDSISYDTIRHLSYFSKDKYWRVEETRVTSSSCVTETVSTAFLKSLTTRPALRVPLLSELCIRAMKRSAVDISAATCNNGGARPDIPWMKQFDIQRIPENQIAQFALQLQRCGILHQPQVYRLFQRPGVPGLMQSRLVRSSLFTKEYIGFDHGEQGHWGVDFFFSLLQDTLFGHKSATLGIGDGEFKSEDTLLKTVITSINKLRPRFVVVSGNLTAARYGEEHFESQLEGARKCLCRVSETIPLLFVPGPNTVGEVPTLESIEFYNSKFGADYFGFFYGGFRCLVLNSALMLNPRDAPELAAQQDSWFAEEIEQSKLHATHIAVFSYHPWFLRSADEEDSLATFPRSLREKWLPMMRHGKVKYLFCSALSPHGTCVTEWDKCGGLVHKKIKGCQKIESMEVVSPSKVSLNHSEVDKAYVMQVEADVDAEPLKPSEIVNTSAVEDNDSTSSGDDDAAEVSEDEVTKKEEEFLNVDDEYEGPHLVLTCPCCADAHAHTASESVIAEAPPIPVAAHMAAVRMILVLENDVKENLYPSNAIPTNCSW